MFSSTFPTKDKEDNLPLKSTFVLAKDVMISNIEAITISHGYQTVYFHWVEHDKYSY